MACWAVPAHAQPIEATDVKDADTPPEVPADVTVTGVRQQYRGDVPLRDLPQSVQVLSVEKLAEAGLTRLDDALDFASGVARQTISAAFSTASPSAASPATRTPPATTC